MFYEVFRFLIKIIITICQCLESCINGNFREGLLEKR